MNNNTTEDYCSFEVSKLLKEKGFNVPCFSYYQLNKKFRFFKREQDIVTNWYEKEEYEIDYKGENDFKEAKVEKLAGTSRPTHALAIKWIRENFSINIMSPFYCKNLFSLALKKNKSGWTCEIQILEKIDTDDEIIFQEDETGVYNLPEEATEAALLYTLKNLIQ